MAPNNELDLSGMSPMPPVVPDPSAPVTVQPGVKIASPGRVLLAALGVGVFGTVLFYSQDIGVNAVLFVAALIAAMALLAKNEAAPTQTRNLWLVLPPIFFFAAMTAIRASSLLTFWNVFACVLLLLWAAHFWAAGKPKQTGIWGFIGGAIVAMAHCAVQFIPTSWQAVENARTNAPETDKKNSALPVLRGVFIALPILGVFIALLSSADAVFAHTVHSAGGLLVPSDIGEVIGRVVLTVFLSWGATGGLVYALTRRNPIDDALANAPAKPAPLGFVEAITVLASVCSVFAAFVAIQFTYLFGGASATSTGLNFAQYARKGFWELVVVACLTLVLISTLRTLTRRATTAQATVFNTSGTVLVALTLVLLASAAKRMGLFEASFGSTELRLWVDVFLCWLAAALLFFVWTLWTNAKTFAFGGVVCACGMLLTVNLLNAESIVAVRNFARQAALHQDADGYYFIPIDAPDAVPALLAKWESLPKDSRSRKMLGSCLRVCLSDLQKQHNATAWPSWNVSRSRALRLLEAREANLPTVAEAESYTNTRQTRW